MEYVLTAAEMKKCDEFTTTEYGIPSMVLMERAALETARLIIKRYGTDISVGMALQLRGFCRNQGYLYRCI